MPEMSLQEISGLRIECPQCLASFPLPLRAQGIGPVPARCTVCERLYDDDAGRSIAALADLAQLLHWFQRTSPLRLVLESGASQPLSSREEPSSPLVAP